MEEWMHMALEEARAALAEGKALQRRGLHLLQQFPAGSRYDADSLRAAHELISGRRALRSDALYYQAADASAPWSDEYLVSSAGNYNFYCEDGNA